MADLSSKLQGLWQHHHAELRDAGQIVAQWSMAADVDPDLLDCEIRGDWWTAVERSGATLLVTREYEHLALGLSMTQGKPRTSYLRVPHPSGIAVDSRNRTVHLASTRNPNMIYDFSPCCAFLAKRKPEQGMLGLLLPVQARYFPGSLYTHDLAMIGDQLHANAVGMNAIVAFDRQGSFKPVWWPQCIDSAKGPRFEKNFLQLNSIAVGSSLEGCYFSASAPIPSSRRPGHRNFPVDGRGVIFSGKTRQVIAGGLTRPHSARLRGAELWVNNSGYGQCGRISKGDFHPVFQFNGWTRGLCFRGNLAFIGTSRVIPRFRHYAPGLDAELSECGVHAVDLKAAKILGSIIWPRGNQIFAIEAAPAEMTAGFPFTVQNRAHRRRQRDLFFSGLSTRPERPRKREVSGIGGADRTIAARS